MTVAGRVLSQPSPKDWLGHVSQTREWIAPSHVARVAAALGVAPPGPGQALPALWHWAFFQPAEDPEALGEDGHPARGGFLPPAEGRMRMWAGGRFEFHRPLTVATPAVRYSEIIAVEEKQGRSGALLFVTVRHDYHDDEALAFREEQDIVYRQPAAPRLSIDEPPPAFDWSETVTPEPVLLFRYSAVTFNGHRIHYDWPYATQVEGYPGLVVHGPLIATFLFEAFVRARPAARIRSFAFRSQRPLIAPSPFTVAGRLDEPGQARLWAGNADGPAQQGEMVFEEP